MSQTFERHGSHAGTIYAREALWQDLGITLNATRTAEEALKAAHLDWEVIKQPVRAAQLDRFKLLRGDTLVSARPVVLGIVGPEYTPFQNREAFEFLDTIVRLGSGAYESAGALGQGQRIWAMLKLRGHMRIAGEDLLTRYLLLSNSHTEGTLQVKFTPMRLACTNMLQMVLLCSQGFTMRHGPSLQENFQKVAESLLTQLSQCSADLESRFQKMAHVRVNESRLNEYLGLVFPMPLWDNGQGPSVQFRTKSRELFYTGRGNQEPSVRGTLWAAYNGVVEFVDYHLPSSSPEQRLESIWFGQGQTIKQRAYEVALQMANNWPFQKRTWSASADINFPPEERVVHPKAVKLPETADVGG